MELKEEIKNRVCGIDEEAYFWMKEDLARQYLRLIMSDEDRKKYMRSKTFWQWWHRIMDLNEGHVLTEMDERAYDTVNLAYFKDLMFKRIKTMGWKLSNHVKLNIKNNEKSQARRRHAKV